MSGAFAVHSELVADLMATARTVGRIDETGTKTLVEKAHDGDVNARNRLVVSNSPLAVKIAHRYAKNGVDIDDLVQEGVVGIIRGIATYTFEKPFSAHIRSWIWQAQFSYVRDTFSLVKRYANTADSYKNPDAGEGSAKTLPPRDVLIDHDRKARLSMYSGSESWPATLEDAVVFGQLQRFGKRVARGDVEVDIVENRILTLVPAKRATVAARHQMTGRRVGQIELALRKVIGAACSP